MGVLQSLLGRSWNHLNTTLRMMESMKIAQRSTHPHNKILYHFERMSFLFVLSTKLMPPLKVNLVSSFSLITSSFMAPVQIRIDPVSEKSLVALRLRQFKRGCLGRGLLSEKTFVRKDMKKQTPPRSTKLLLVLKGGLHSTEVAFLLLAQHPRV